MEAQPRDALPQPLPVVGETWDAFLNDIEGRHVSAEHVLRGARECALRTA